MNRATGWTKANQTLLAACASTIFTMLRLPEARMTLTKVSVTATS
jgi:hypothetical protein